jgi:CubicO group peptidase (beta-lactamase class C family)
MTILFCVGDMVNKRLFPFFIGVLFLVTHLAGTSLDNFEQSLDSLIENAIVDRRIPGAVLLISRDSEIILHKAYGYRSVDPTVESMTLDTIFDVASLTKPLVTSTVIMRLVECGILNLDDTVSQHLPGFNAPDKEMITIEHLLRHTSGLEAELSAASCMNGMAHAISAINHRPLVSKPGTHYLYSCVGFILLGAVIEAVMHRSLAACARQEIFEPLAMQHTMFCPSDSFLAHVAPTEKVEDRWLCGTVHDHKARAFGGVAGNAGLFSTARDIAHYAHMLINNGMHQGIQFFKAETVTAFIAPASNASPGSRRGLGWDIDAHPSNAYAYFGAGSFGHSGFTGTYIWIDSNTKTVIIFLSNQLHPRGKIDIVALYKKIAETVASRIN